MGGEVFEQVVQLQVEYVQEFQTANSEGGVGHDVAREGLQGVIELLAEWFELIEEGVEFGEIGKVGDEFW